MIITWHHMSVTLLIALLLHAAVAVLFAMPAPEPLPEPPVQQLRVSLLAVVAERSTTAAPVIPPPPRLEPPPQPKPELVPKPAPKRKPAPEPVIQKPAPKPQPATEPMPEPPKPKPPAVEAPAVAAEPIQERVPQPPPAEPAAVPLDAVATAKYEQLLVAWLEQHKKYPRRAKRMRIEGEGRLRILIDRTGRIQHVTLEQRTGNRLLDKAALKMAERADPFPPMPENDPRQELAFIVPVLFALR